MKKQAEATSAEYDRLTSEFQKLQVWSIIWSYSISFMSYLFQNEMQALKSKEDKKDV